MILKKFLVCRLGVSCTVAFHKQISSRIFNKIQIRLIEPQLGMEEAVRWKYWGRKLCDTVSLMYSEILKRSIQNRKSCNIIKIICSICINVQSALRKPCFEYISGVHNCILCMYVYKMNYVKLFNVYVYILIA